MNSKKNLVLIPVLATLIMASAQPADAMGKKPAANAGAFCDLRVEQSILRRENERTVVTLDGRSDYHGTTVWWRTIKDGILFLASFPVSLFFVEYRSGGWDLGGYGFFADGDKSDPMYYAQKNDAIWVAETKRLLTGKCNSFIRKHFTNDVIWDDGFEVQTPHYRCGTPYTTEGSSEDQYSIDVIRGEPVYEALTTEQIYNRKCGKLAICMAHAGTQEQLDFVTQNQVKLGCQ